MARYTGPREKIERRIGEKLFLKGERSRSQKSATVKKPYPPGMHGHKRPGKQSEFGLQLRSKQKVKNIYRLLEKQFKRTIKTALASKQEPYIAIIAALELRLDNVVYRLGLAQSRDQARQLVNHGHIMVNDKRVSVASYAVKNGDKISIREGSKKTVYFSSMAPQWIKNYETPTWLLIDKGTLVGEVKSKPTMQESGIKSDDLQAIIEFYSR